MARRIRRPKPLRGIDLSPEAELEARIGPPSPTRTLLEALDVEHGKLHSFFTRNATRDYRDGDRERALYDISRARYLRRPSP